MPEPLSLPNRPHLAASSPSASIPADLQVLDLNDPTVKAAARKLLDENGLASSPLRLWQAFKCDLDLDGTPEIVMAGSLVADMITENPLDGYYANDGQGKPGDYYLLAVFHEDLSGALTLAWSEIEARPQYPIMLETFAVADVNGDRIPEIGLFIKGYEWGTWALYQWDGKELLYLARSGYAA